MTVRADGTFEQLYFFLECRECPVSCVGYHGTVVHVDDYPEISETWDWVHQMARDDRDGCIYFGDDLNFYHLYILLVVA